jgi:carbon storage regulator
MLVLSRKVGERILIGDHIAVTIVRVTGGGVRVGIEAPPEMAVLRAEIKAAFEAHAGNGIAASHPVSPAALSSDGLPSSATTPSSDTNSSILVKPTVAEVVEPPSEVPPVRKPR